MDQRRQPTEKNQAPRQAQGQPQPSAAKRGAAERNLPNRPMRQNPPRPNSERSAGVRPAAQSSSAPQNVVRKPTQNIPARGDTAQQRKKAEKPAAAKPERKSFRLSDFRFFSWLSQRKKAILENESKQNEIPENIVRVRGGIDRPMLVIILILLCYGSVMVFSSSYAYALSDMGDSYYYIRKQIIYVIMGLCAMVFMAHLDYKKWVQRFTPLYFIVCLAMMCAVLAVGIKEGDAKRWLDLGFVTVQPSEFMKLGLVLILAWLHMHITVRIVTTKR